MDIELARTFLEIMQAGTFAKASERLHVTQTTVTARIQTLEQQLDCCLFVRNRRGARLTKEGERFADYARQMITLWQRAQEACQQQSQDAKETLLLGCENSLWNPIMVDWVAELTALDNLQLSANVATTETLYDEIRAGRLDAALVHSARYYPELSIEQLAQEKLVHVASSRCPTPNLYIDWGEEFDQQFDRCLPFSRQTAHYYSLGPLALKVMLQRGGNGYFRTRVVQHHLDAGTLQLVEHSPEFQYPIYLVSRSDRAKNAFHQAQQTLQAVLDHTQHWVI